MKYFNWFFLFVMSMVVFTNITFADFFTDQIPPGIKTSIIVKVTCSNYETFINDLVTPYQEKSVFSGVVINPQTGITGGVIEIFYNEESQSFTLAKHFPSGNNCLLGSGEIFNIDMNN